MFVRWNEKMGGTLYRSCGDLILAGEAYIWLGLMRVAILLLPFRSIVRLLGLKPAVPVTVELTGRDVGEADRIGWAVRVVACRTPWESSCLGQALAGAGMLRMRGLHVVVTLGIAGSYTVEKMSPLMAHAWLCCGCRQLTGGSGLNRYTVLASFSDRSSCL